MKPITFETYKDIAAELKLPYDVVLGIGRLRRSLMIDSDNVGFYHVVSEKPFLGYVNGVKVESWRDLYDSLMKFPIKAGFNCYRVENVRMGEELPLLMRGIQLGTFTFWKSTGLWLDLMPLFFLWKPAGSHTMRSLSEKMGLRGEVSTYTVAMSRFWNFAKQILNFAESEFFIGPETLCMTWHSGFGYARLRRIMLQSFVLKRGIWPELFQREDDRSPSFFLHNKPGIHRDVNIFDVKSAYPQTVVNLNIGLWKQGDLAEYEKFLMWSRDKFPDISFFLKWIANATIGDLNFTDGLIRDKKVLCDVWLTFREIMCSWTAPFIDEVVFSYVDSVYTKKAEVPPLPGYKVILKHRCSWVAIYNQQRLIFMGDDDKIIMKHFDKRLKLKMYEYVDEMVKALLASEGPDILYRPIEIIMDSLPDDAFLLHIFKDGPCHDQEYFEIWFDLKDGENAVYLSKDGVTTNPKKLCRSRYKEMLQQYLKLFLMEVKNGEKK